jgi:hypothetical protein
MASPQSCLADLVPVTPQAPQRQEPSEEQFKRPLIRVSIETGQVVEDRLPRREEAQEMPKPRGTSKWTPEILRLWGEGLGAGQIDSRLHCSSKTARSVLLDHGVTAEELDARRVRATGKRVGLEAADARIGGLCPVEESLGGEAPEARQSSPRDLEAPLFTGVPWRVLCEGISCDTCLHGHVCGRRTLVSENEWMACRDWRRREAS